MAHLTIFTLPKPFTDSHISMIQRNALASWVALGDDVEVLVMGDDEGVAEAAREAGATHIGEPAVNEFGTPLLDWAFRTAAERGSGELLCYVNGDIALLADFTAALHRLPGERWLAIGQRWNCDVDAPLDLPDADGEIARWARASGWLDQGRGSDYFAFPRALDFGLPPFAVGRPGWDNWMMGRALELKVPLIDLTPVTTVIHQNHDYGHVAARSGTDWEGPEADRNRELAGPIDRYVHSPANATHLLTPTGLAPARSARHIRAKAEELYALRPVAAPLRGLVRGARRIGPLSRIAERGVLAPVGARVACARIVRESFAFAGREITRPSQVHSYHLRESGLVVPLRHAAQDSATLAEVFHRRDYDPPPAVLAALGEPSTILDLGANIGLFGLYAAARWPSARIVAYEADPENAEVHRRAIEANGLGSRWHLTAAAAGAHAGEVELAGGRAMGSFVIEPGSDPGVPTIHVPMVDVMAEVCSADLVKLDIEGGEWEILADGRFQADPPRVSVLEYHPHLCPEPDPRGVAERLVRSAGLETASIWHRDDAYGMFWAWRA